MRVSGVAHGAASRSSAGQDRQVLHDDGKPQACLPLLSNLYLNEVDRMLELAQDVTRNGMYTNVEYARFVDDSWS